MRIAIVMMLAVRGLSQTPPPADDKASVEGSVTNALTGEPLLHAHVSLRASAGGVRRNLTALTEADGKFAIANVPAGSYTATAERVGFTYTTDRTGRFGIPITVRAGDKKDDVKLKLTPTGAINGRVVDADGEPMEGISVSAIGRPSAMGQTASTDDKGQFRIGGLSPGKYRVRAAPVNMPLPPEIRTDGTAEVNYAQTYYPNSRTEKGAGRVNIQGGAEVGGIGIQMIRAPIVCVSGTVVGVPRVAERMMVELAQAGGPRHMGMVKTDGSFQVWRIEPGKYTVTATWNLNGQTMRTAPVDIEVAESNIEHLELRFVPPSDIAGQVEYDDEQARQSPQPKGQPQQATPRPPPPSRLSFFDISGTHSNQFVDVAGDGSFRLEAMLPGRYRVTTSWGPYVKSMRLGQTVIDGNILDLRNGAAGAPLSVLVSSATGEISGVVRDDKGPVAAMVGIVAADADMYSFPMMVNSGEDGAYRIAGIAPGKYKLAAIEDNDIQGLRSRDPEEDDAVELIEIRAGDKLTKDLKQGPRP